MAKNMIKFFYKTYILIKQVKHIPIILVTRVKISRKIIYIDLVSLIISTKYDRSKYSLFLIDDVTHAITGVFFKQKIQVKVKLSKYTKNLQI